MSTRLHGLISAALASVLIFANSCDVGYADDLSSDVGSTPAEVGTFGDLERLVFVGAETFTADAIRTGLSANAEFLFASHPLAPFETYLQTLSTLITRGFQRTGFPAANVNAHFDAATGTVLVIIEEGPRYTNGDVRVVGAGALDLGAFTRRLTQQWPADYTDTVLAPTEPKTDSTEESHQGQDGLNVETFDKPAQRHLDNQGRQIEPQAPIWQRGKLTAFDNDSIQRLNSGVSLALQDFGYFFAKFTVTIIPVSGSATAELHVDLEDLGPKAIISDLVVTGNVRDSRESLLTYLGLESGMTVDGDLVAGTERKLWQSARYRRYEVTPELTDSAPPKVNLNIDVTEYETAPSLADMLSSDEHALLRFCDWLSAAESRGDDFVLEMISHSLNISGQLVLSRDGAALSIRSLADQIGGTRDLRILLTGESTNIASAAQHTKLIIPSPMFEVVLDLSWLPSPRQNRTPELSAGAGYKTLSGAKANFSGNTPIRFDVVFAPAACMSFAHRTDFERTMSNGILSFDDGSTRLSINPTSGQLIELNYGSGESAARLRVEHAAFETERHATEKLEVTYPNKFEESVPLNSILSFAIQELLVGDYINMSIFNDADPQTRRQTAKVVDGMFSDHLLAPMDSLLSEIRRKLADSFFIPASAEGGVGADMVAAGMVFALVNGLFPRDSWPWVTAREAFFLVAGMGEYTDLELERIYRSEDVGPIGYLTIAELLNKIEAQGTIPIAQRGLEEMDAENFRKDVVLLLRRGSTLAAVAERLAASLSDLSDDDLRALSAIISPQNADLLKELVQRSRKPGGEAVSNVFAEAFDSYWNTLLRAKVEARLKELAQDSSSQL